MNRKSLRTAWANAALALCLSASALVAGSAHAVDPDKVIRMALPAADDGFDMARSNNNLYSTTVGEAIFETLVTYDYLARPAKLVPGTAEAMPEITDDGKTYLFHIKKGILFGDDPVFGGKPRELTAEDYAYTIKRILDPKNRSAQYGNFEGKLVGMDELVAAAKKSGKFDYDKKIPGIEVVDRYTLRIRLNYADTTMLYLLAHSTAGAMAREVVEHYGVDTGRHPVGTGPYMLTEYVPRGRIVLTANPHYRGFVWDFKSSGEAWDEQLIKDMHGKKMPQIGRVEIAIVEEEQSRWLAFQGGQFDYTAAGEAAIRDMIDKDKLRPEAAKTGLKLYRYTEPAIYYTFFNFNDPVIGGYSLEKNALRRAITMAYEVDDEIRLLRNNQAMRAESTIPPGLAGFDPKYRSSIPYDPDLANKLLDRFGYKRGADGYRTLPDGKPLVLKMQSSQSSRDVVSAEIWKRSMDRVGLHMEFPVSSFADSLKAANNCQLMMWMLGGTAGIPDGVDFLQSFYGGNLGAGNLGCYKSDAFDDMYRKAAQLPDGPERTQIYNTMSRQLEADTAELPQVWRIANILVRPWVKGFKRHPIFHAEWQYLDVEKH